MPVAKMQQTSALFDPAPPTAPMLDRMSGRAGTVKPLTERAYQQIERALGQQNRRLTDRAALGQGPIQLQQAKLGFFIGRARIPRVLALKLADLTEGYHKQLEALMEAIDAVGDGHADLAAPELEGAFEKSRVTAERFQDAMEGIEQVFEELRDMSAQTAFDTLKSIMEAAIDPPTKEHLVRFLAAKYHLEITQPDPTKPAEVTPSQTLLPLLKGTDVYAKKKQTFEYLLSARAAQNKSVARPNVFVTSGGTRIEVLYQVQPKHETNVFSDHAGFVVKFSRVTRECPPLYVYYQSLEHGHQHTATRTAWNYGSQTPLHVMQQWQGSLQPEKAQSFAVHDPRLGYVGKLQSGLLSELIKVAEGEQASVMLIVGECTLSVHEALLDLVLQFSIDSVAGGRVRHSAPRVHGIATQAAGYDLQMVHASKAAAPSKKSGDPGGEGLGVHALMAYLFLRTDMAAPQRAFTLEASLLTLGDATRQNILTLGYGPQKELHAFAHLLNRKEDALANELKACGYLSVAGDLNNISVGTDLVETVNENQSFMAMGSNSTSSTMYDKVTIL